LAFTTYTLLIKTGLEQLLPSSKLESVAKQFGSEFMLVAKKSRKLALHNAALVGLTVLSGAYVAGNDAGRAFNTFPKMGDVWIPDEIFSMQPLWKNFVENTALVQLNHRILALSTAAAISFGYVKARMNTEFWKQLPKLVKFSFHASMGMVLVQVSLGISTLLYYVPIELASAHQTGAILLLTVMTGLVHSLGFTKYGKSLKVSTSTLSQLLLKSPCKSSK
jgi:cytochrome c oxidase assembly protein subunit 15